MRISSRFSRWAIAFVVGLFSRYTIGQQSCCALLLCIFKLRRGEKKFFCFSDQVVAVSWASDVICNVAEMKSERWKGKNARLGRVWWWCGGFWGFIGELVVELTLQDVQLLTYPPHNHVTNIPPRSDSSSLVLSWILKYQNLTQFAHKLANLSRSPELFLANSAICWMSINFHREVFLFLFCKRKKSFSCSASNHVRLGALCFRLRNAGVMASYG